MKFIFPKPLFKHQCPWCKELFDIESWDSHLDFYQKAHSHFEKYYLPDKNKYISYIGTDLYIKLLKRYPNNKEDICIFDKPIKVTVQELLYPKAFCNNDSFFSFKLDKKIPMTYFDEDAGFGYGAYELIFIDNIVANDIDFIDGNLYKDYTLCNKECTHFETSEELIDWFQKNS